MEPTESNLNKSDFLNTSVESAKVDMTDLETLVYSKLGDLFKEYMLSEIQCLAAFNYIKSSFTNLDPQSSKVRSWVLNRINNKSFPKGYNSYQIGCPDICPGIISKNFHDPLQFDFIKELLKNVDIIKEELLNIREVSKLNGFQPYKSPKSYSSIESKDGLGSLAHDKGDWNVFYLFLHEIKFEKNCEQCPKTVQLIQENVPRQY